MQKVRGLVFASVLLSAASAQAFQLNVHTPVHLNPQPLPPGMTLNSQSRGSAGNLPNETFSLNFGKINPQYQKQQSGTSTHGPKSPLQYDKHKDW